MKIQRADFIRWRDDFVTQAIFKALFNVRESTQHAILDPNTLFGPEGDKYCARLMGQIEGMNLFLEISAEEIVEGDELE